MLPVLGVEVATAVPAERVLVTVGADPGRGADVARLVKRSTRD
jgi:hypothetical protein